MMDFGVGLGAELPFDEVAEHSRVADECGYSHITFVDQSNVSRECLGMMTLAAQNTRRTHIGHGVVDPVMYHPAAIGNFSASLREPTGGRTFIGIGAGTPAAGKTVSHPAGLKVQRESVEFLRAFTAGEEATLWGNQWHSEWIRNSTWSGKPIEIWMGPLGPRAMALAGEVADQIWFFGCGEPELVKFYLEQIQKGAERAERDFTKIKVWARTEVFICDRKEDAFNECSSYAASCAREIWSSAINWNRPEAADLNNFLERVSPGLVGEMKMVYDHFDLYFHESIKADHKQYTSSRIMDMINLVGPVEEIIDKIRTLEELGVYGVSAVQYAVPDQKANMRRIADQIMPHFR